MKKSDSSLREICISNIKRKTFKPYTFKWTKFYETNVDFTANEVELDLIEGELVVASTIIDRENYSVVTTRRIITKQGGKLKKGEIYGAIDQLYDDFKASSADFTLGIVLLKSGIEINYFIETGNASMVMIQGVRTLIRLTAN